MLWALKAMDQNPALRWLRDYEQQSARKQDRNQTVRPLGAFGENEYGLADIGGNVWEWTQTCHRRVNIDAYGKVASETTVCGVYVVNGKHRAAMSSFIRNPKTGDAAWVFHRQSGLPPCSRRRWYAPVLMRLKDFTS